MGYYDYRAFGNPLTPPYTVNRNTYAIAPYYVWQHERPEPTYRYPRFERSTTKARRIFLRRSIL